MLSARVSPSREQAAQSRLGRGPQVSPGRPRRGAHCEDSDGAARAPRPGTLAFPWTLQACGCCQRAVPKVMNPVMLSGNRVLSSNPASSTDRKRETISHLEACASLKAQWAQGSRRIPCGVTAAFSEKSFWGGFGASF